MKLSAVVALLAVYLAKMPIAEARDLGMGLLMIWPSARSTALAGAMTGLADEADATYFDPAGLAFQTAAKADLTHNNWLPGLYPGMYYESAIGGAPVRLPFLQGRNAFIAVSLAYMTVGETDIVNEHGDYLGRVNVWRGAAAMHAAVSLTRSLGAGIGLKLLRSVHTYDFWEWEMGTDAGFEPGGNTTAVATDVALLYRPSVRVSLGLAVSNLGPDIRYRPDYGDPYAADLPRMARLGLCWTGIDGRNVRLRVMPELTKVLVGMFSDRTGKSSGNQLSEEWRDVSKALGIEMTAFDLVSIRLGYLEDLNNESGGLIYQREGWYSLQHYGLWDVITRRGLGQFRRIGLCWGIGIGTNTLRFDLSSDAAIYDFPTQNWKLQLNCNNIGRLFGRRS